jgi:hydrogenase-4 component F
MAQRLGVGGVGARITTLAASAASLGLALHAARVVAQTGSLALLGGWFGLNALGALFLLLTAALIFSAALFSWSYIAVHTDGEPPRERAYHANFNLFAASLLAVPLMQEPALAWVAVELTTLFSIFLVGFDNTRPALEAAWKYAVITIMGATVAALGFFLLLWSHDRIGGGAQTFDALITSAPQMPIAARKLAFALILVGFGTKIGLVPLHTWLPDAHSQAPTPVCALLSGIEVSLVLYVVMRLLPIFIGVPGFHLGAWLCAVGLLSTGVAAFLLLQVRDYKRLFAYSTVEHMGILTTALGLGAGGSYGTVYHTLTHALTKSAAFYAAGAVLLATGTREIAEVRGLLRTRPATGAALLAAGLAIAGAPPFAVFLSEFVILRAGVVQGQYVVVALLATFVAIAFIGVMQQINRMVFGEPHPDARAVPQLVLFTAWLALTPVLVLGLWMPPPLARLLADAAATLTGAPR